MSHHLFGQSANRGECIQPCRREYEIFDTAAQKSMLVGDDYVLSSKDLCTIEFIDQLIEAGIDSFKIEGRKELPNMLRRLFLFIEKRLICTLRKNYRLRRKKNFLKNWKQFTTEVSHQDFISANHLQKIMRS